MGNSVSIKVDFLKMLLVEPAKCGGVQLSAYLGGVLVGSHTATPDQCVALVDAIQAALENKAAA